MTPVVGKLFEITIVILYIGVLVTSLYGGLVPDYREAAGQELAERTLSQAAQQIEAAVPPTSNAVEIRAEVDLQTSIANANYEIRVEGRTLILDHPNRAIDDSMQLLLPETVDSVEGSWQSGAETVVRVSGDSDGLTVELTEVEQ